MLQNAHLKSNVAKCTPSAVINFQIDTNILSAPAEALSPCKHHVCPDNEFVVGTPDLQEKLVKWLKSVEVGRS
jgi:hypothetical protein